MPNHASADLDPPARCTADTFVPPTRDEIVAVLRRHPLIRLRESVREAFLVGSFAGGVSHPDSDIDILLEVDPHAGVSAAELEDSYRKRLQQYFVTHDIRGKRDDVHPQWLGRRVDLYFTYAPDAQLQARPTLLLEAPRPRKKPRAG